MSLISLCPPLLYILDEKHHHKQERKSKTGEDFSTWGQKRRNECLASKELYVQAVFLISHFLSISHSMRNEYFTGLLFRTMHFLFDISLLKKWALLLKRKKDIILLKIRFAIPNIFKEVIKRKLEKNNLCILNQFSLDYRLGWMTIGNVLGLSSRAL